MPRNSIYLLLTVAVMFCVVACDDNGISYQSVVSDDNGAWFETTYVCTDNIADCASGGHLMWFQLVGSKYDGVPPYFILKHDEQYYYILAEDIYWLIDPSLFSNYLPWSAVYRNMMPYEMFDRYGIIKPDLYHYWVEYTQPLNEPYIPDWNSAHPRWDDFYEWLSNPTWDDQPPRRETCPWWWHSHY